MAGATIELFLYKAVGNVNAINWSSSKISEEKNFIDLLEILQILDERLKLWMIFQMLFERWKNGRTTADFYRFRMWSSEFRFL